MDNFDKLKEIIFTIHSNHEVYLELNIIPELKLRDDLEMDSIMLAELSVRVEDEFGIDVFENGMVYTVKDILTIIDKP